MKKHIFSHVAVLGIVVAALAFVACDDSSNAVVENPDAGKSSSSSGQTTSGDAGPVKFDAGVDDAGQPKDCFDDPKTHFEIINACTNADKVVRTPKSSKILADGGVPKP